MAQYLVDFEGEKRRWSAGAAKPYNEPHTHYFKKPLEERLAIVCNARAAEGWRLLHVASDARSDNAAPTPTGFYLFFER